MVRRAWCVVRGGISMAALGFLAISPSRPLAAQASPPPQPPYAADSAAVLDVARTTLHAMRVSDTATMRRLFQGSVPMRIAGYRNGAPVIGIDSGSSWVSSVAATPAGTLDERIGTPSVQVDGNLAQVWTYYEFRNGERFSHCGADHFILGRTDAGWKIISLSYSGRREGCRQDLAFTPRDRAMRDMVAAERAFAHYADTAYTGAAFVWALRTDAITLDSSGVKSMRPLYENRRNNGALLSWGPSWADVSADGEMGFTLGPWTWRPARDSAVQARGHFMTIWIKGEARWQVALDLGVGGDSTSRLDEPLIEMPAGTTGPARLTELTGLEGARMRGAGWVRGLQALSAPEVRVLREDRPMGIGPQAIAGASSVRFTPLGGRVAGSGDLGATWGTYRDGVKKGAYVRFWKRTSEGWRVVVDRMAE
jgi:putative lumazine-binding protein